MSELSPAQAMDKAIGTLWNRFLESDLSQPAALARAGLESYTGSAGWHGWDGQGDFYGSATIWFKRLDGIQFFWTSSVLFEQGENAGQHWQQGAAYAYASTFTSANGSEQIYYNIGEAPLPADPMTVNDLRTLAQTVTDLSNKCYEDLRFVYENNLFEKLLVLARDKERLADEKARIISKKDISVEIIDEDNDLYTWRANPLKE